MTVIHVDKPTAAEALRKTAVRYDDPDHDAFGRTHIHCLLGPFGADWDLDDAIRLLSQATDIGWVEHLIGHDLAVVANVTSFDPDEEPTVTCPGPDECFDDLCRGQVEGLCGKLSARVLGIDDGYDDEYPAEDYDQDETW